MFSNLKKVLKLSIVTSALLSTQLLADFYIMVNNQQKGPLSIEQISQMKANGSISSDSLVWQNGMADWGKAIEQVELKSLFNSPPPPPPSTMTPPPPPSVGIQDVDTEQNRLSSADVIANENPQTLEDWKKDFEDKFDVTIGMAEDGKTFFFGESIVKVNPLDPAYSKELVFTYDKAMLNLQSNFVMQTYGTLVVKSISDIFENDSTNADEFESIKLKKMAKQGKISLIIDKMVDVVDKKLDTLLIEQGVPLDEIQKRTEEQKKVLFKDNFRKIMMKKAFASMSGLVPVQTKIITTSRFGKKTVKLGVIAVMSDKTMQFAKDSSKKRTTHVKGTPSSIKKILPSTNKGFLDEVGLRYVYDKQGRPMLLSYGRWSVVGQTPNPARYERKIQLAKEKARIYAESYISDFMKSNIDVMQSADAQSSSEEVIKKISTIENNKVTDSQKTREDISETLDIYFKKIQKKSNLRLRGTTQVKTWEAKDKNGILHVGSVIVWSYSQLENANNIVHGTKKKKYVEQRAKQVIRNVSRESRVVNSVDDF